MTLRRQSRQKLASFFEQKNKKQQSGRNHGLNIPAEANGHAHRGHGSHARRGSESFDSAAFVNNGAGADKANAGKNLRRQLRRIPGETMD